MFARVRTHEICQKYLDGDVKGSAALQLKYHKLVQALFSDVNPIRSRLQ